MENLIGKQAYRKSGLFTGLVGVVEKNDNTIAPYKLVTEKGMIIPFVDIEDIEFVKKPN